MGIDYARTITSTTSVLRDIVTVAYQAEDTTEAVEFAAATARFADYLDTIRDQVVRDDADETVEHLEKAATNLSDAYYSIGSPVDREIDDIRDTLRDLIARLEEVEQLRNLVVAVARNTGTTCWEH